jgi:hypothetical protein
LAQPGAYVQMAHRDSGAGFVYRYEDNQAIRNAAGGEMRPEEFGRLRAWLDPVGDERADEPRRTARRVIP